MDETTAMRRCPGCGAERRPGVLYCPGCGALLADTVVRAGVAAAVPNSANAPVVAVTPSLAPGLLRLAALLLIVVVALAAWTALIGNDVPVFRSVLDLKISLATLVLLLAMTQVLTAARFYGWLGLPWPPGEAAAFVHRWTGRLLLPAAVLVTIYCVKDIGPQSTPTRAAVHTVLGSMVFVVVAAKLLILRAAPRLSTLVPMLGLLTAVLFIGIWFSSAFFMLRNRAQGYSDAETGATVTIVTDAAVIGRFEPPEVRLRPGQVVEWVNRSDAPHNAVKDGGGFDSGLIAAGGSFRWPAKTPGTITYRCTIHPSMPVARIVVEDK